ncbi:MAG: hypothetical protein QW161_00960 [Candidatus Bathyarchaeia archaeon]
MVEPEVLAGFLVLGFAVFIAGFLAGVLAIGLVPLEMEFVALFTVFSLGYIAGTLTVALALVAFQILKLRKSS